MCRVVSGPVQLDTLAIGANAPVNLRENAIGEEAGERVMVSASEQQLGCRLGKVDLVHLGKDVGRYKLRSEYLTRPRQSKLNMHDEG